MHLASRPLLIPLFLGLLLLAAQGAAHGFDDARCQSDYKAYTACRALLVEKKVTDCETLDKETLVKHGLQFYGSSEGLSSRLACINGCNDAAGGGDAQPYEVFKIMHCAQEGQL